MKNNYTNLEHLKLVAQRLAEAGRDITADYADWINVTFACASLGEQAREAYHTICSLYSGYKREECDEKFTNCLKAGNGSVTLGSLMKMAQDAGIDLSASADGCSKGFSGICIRDCSFGMSVSYGTKAFLHGKREEACP